MVSRLKSRRVGILLACGAALVVAGCGTSTISGNSSAKALAGAPSWCGHKKIMFALADGLGGNNWRRVTVGEARNEVAKCPSVAKVLYTDGQGNTEKAISDIHGIT